VSAIPKSGRASGAFSTTGGRLRLVVAVTIGVLITPAGKVLADNVGATPGCGYEYGVSDDYVPPGEVIPVNCVSHANNKWHAVRPYSFGNQWAGAATAFQNSVSGDYDPTELVAYWTTTDSLPDVRLWDWWYTHGVVAWVDCPADNTGIGYKAAGQATTRWCRGQIIRLDANFAENYNAYGRDWIACHELSHTVGLRHDDDYLVSCTAYPVGGTVSRDLSPHDKATIDYWY